MRAPVSVATHNRKGILRRENRFTRRKLVRHPGVSAANPILAFRVKARPRRMSASTGLPKSATIDIPDCRRSRSDASDGVRTMEAEGKGRGAWGRFEPPTRGSSIRGVAP